MAEAPLGLFEKCTTLLGRFEAEENVRWVQRIGIGSGMRPYTVGKSKRPLLEVWIEASQPDQGERPARVYPTAAELRARGFKVFSPKP